MRWAWCPLWAVLALGGCAVDSPGLRVQEDVGVQADVGPSDASGDLGADAAADSASPDAGAGPSCVSDEDCVAAQECVAGECGADGFCAWSVLPSFCLVNNVCRAVNERNPSNDCEFCRPQGDPLGFLPVPDGARCTDLNECTDATRCEAGQCQGGEAVLCDDGDPCTDDACDPGRRVFSYPHGRSSGM